MKVKNKKLIGKTSKKKSKEERKNERSEGKKANK